jgi:hypothetical protein
MCVMIRVENGPVEYYSWNEFVLTLRRILKLASKRVPFHVVDDRLQPNKTISRYRRPI